MSTLRPYKFMIVPVIQVVDDEGKVIDEGTPEKPDTVFGVEGLREYADGFESALREKSARMNGIVPASAVGGIVDAGQ